MAEKLKLNPGWISIRDIGGFAPNPPIDIPRIPQPGSIVGNEHKLCLQEGYDVTPADVGMAVNAAITALATEVLRDPETFRHYLYSTNRLPVMATAYETVIRRAHRVNRHAGMVERGIVENVALAEEEAIS